MCQLIKNSGHNIQYFVHRIIGKDDYLTKTLKQISKNQVLIPGSGKFMLQPISILDVCSCINVALTLKFSNKIID